MLYCPKCNQSYEEGVQRFCTNDGARLIGSPGSGEPVRSVFTSVLNRLPNSGEPRSKMFAEVPVLNEPEPIFPKKIAAQTEAAEENFELELGESVETFESWRSDSVEAAAESERIPEPDLPPAKPAARLIRANEIPLSQAALGDRAVNPAGREALTWNNPEILIGQTVKGRYTIISPLGEDETGIVYLAEDKISGGKKIVVRVLMEEDADDLSSRILAEERVSLSHVNHPNVAHLFDSGELLEGFPFIVTEYIAGDSLKEIFGAGEQFNLKRAARIISQAANAVGEAHRSGVLHRNLKPKNIIIGINEAGAEQVKVTDFGVFDGFEEQDGENIAYLSPEQIQGNYPTAASDIYSLAVISFQLITGRLPFSFSTVKELGKSQKEGLQLLPTNLRPDLPSPVDEILAKALAYNPAARYPKARDFGDAFYNALTVAAPDVRKEEGTLRNEEKTENNSKEFSIPKPPVETFTTQSLDSVEQSKPAIADSGAEKNTAPDQIKTVKPTDDLSWEKRSPEPIKPVNIWRVGSIALVTVLLCAVIWGVWMRRPEPPIVAPGAEVLNQNINAQLPQNVEPKKNEPKAEIDVPPQTRTITPPPDTVFFQNSKDGLKDNLLKNFRGFSFYYPKDWIKSPTSTSFVDVARIGATGTPVEQMTVTYYDSKGTLAADLEKFPRLAQEANKKLSALIADYRPVSQGATTINGGWKAYELKFQGSGKTTNGDTIKLWGKCLWIPPARLDVKTGFLITMLATSISPEVKSADDVGVKGELASVLNTFEPVPLDTGY